MATHDSGSFRSLVERCLEGEESAWEELAALIAPINYGICRSMRLTRDESIEILGRTYYLLVKNLDKLRSPENLRSYVATTVRREAMRMIDRSRFIEDALNQELIDLEPAGEEMPDKKLERREASEAVLSALLLIPPRDGKLLRLLFLDESQPSYEEISKQLGIPISSIGPMRKRALDKLRKALGKLDSDF